MKTFKSILLGSTTALMLSGGMVSVKADSINDVWNGKRWVTQDLVPAQADKYVVYHPDLVQAATVFITGGELGPTVREWKDNPKERLPVTWGDNLIQNRDNVFEAGHDVCTVRQEASHPPYFYWIWDFNKMPGPKSVHAEPGIALTVSD